ncbi:MAG: serine hydrolase, partial [Chloroflexota bacterium]
MSKAESAPRVKGQVGPRALLVIGIGIAAVAVGAMAATITLVALDGGSGGSTPAVDASTRSSTPEPSALATPRGTTVTATTPSPAASSSGSPTPIVTPDPGTGGDQPTGPLPATQGDMAENVNLTPAMAELRDELSEKISNYENTVGIDVGFAVTDLQTGETMSIGGNVIHKTGCVINLFGLFAAVDAFQSGAATPSGLEYSIKKGIGGSYPPEVKNFLEAIYGYYPDGVQRARELMSQWGLKVGYYDHIPYYGGSDSPPPNILTPLEVNSVLTRLWDDQLFDEQWTNYTIAVLRDSYSYVNYILQKYLPYSATVGHKIGYYWDYDGWVNNDVGIV